MIKANHAESAYNEFAPGLAINSLLYVLQEERMVCYRAMQITLIAPQLNAYLCAKAIVVNPHVNPLLYRFLIFFKTLGHIDLLIQLVSEYVGPNLCIHTSFWRMNRPLKSL